MNSNIKYNSATPKIGEGIYFTPDVAEILKLPYHRVQYLMKGFWQAKTFGSERNKAINFFGLIEFNIYYYLRNKGLTSSQIKKLHNKLSKDFETDYPFASLKIKTHENQVWLDFKGFLMKADGKLQPSFRQFIEPFLEKIEYGDDFLAKRFFPLKNSKHIVIDPKKQFGKPIISKSGVRTDVIYKFHLGGETNDNICNLYELQPEQVKDAIKYHQPAA